MYRLTENVAEHSASFQRFVFKDHLSHPVPVAFFFPTRFDFTGNHSVCLLQHGTQDNKGKSRVLFTVDKSSVVVYSVVCRGRTSAGAAGGTNCISMCLKWTHSHLELLNLISAVLFVLVRTVKWWAAWLRSTPPIHHKGQTDEMQDCYGPISLMLPPLIMTELCSHCETTTTDYTFALPKASHAITLYRHRIHNRTRLKEEKQVIIVILKEKTDAA